MALALPLFLVSLHLSLKALLRALFKSLLSPLLKYHRLRRGIMLLRLHEPTESELKQPWTLIYLLEQSAINTAIPYTKLQEQRTSLLLLK